VAARKQAGVDVRVLLADPGWIDRNADAAQFLRQRNIPVKYLSTPGIHAKALLADGTRLYVGSINLSYTSLTQNREVGVVLTEPAAAQAFSRTFDGDWAAGTSF
jgi:phosphatidylserine/phosphatidylglycerophosphate/cardiolipin synthase-like enzyme